MLIPQQPQSQTGRWQGSRRISLRRCGANWPTHHRFPMDTGSAWWIWRSGWRRVKALGDEYTGIELSEAAAEAVGEAAMV